ncbi:MAG: DnaJ domain-containing protein [Chitinophagales bacterium]|nr:DnaJ domain-containing protein [Chitinophagales bacterium]MCO5281708.1 DnaJ domain-containing protein [Chitinophagales bacterium]OJV29091.1 MAG: hypothetical protein BGO32_07265 [Bacteroidetes bacterium 37-13]HRN94676.1 DnaJ domain-containing protein [Chitinophagales bacterium]HRP39864.1 DnaJ domain-containing protein [Chitinophagales bacterium]
MFNFWKKEIPNLNRSAVPQHRNTLEYEIAAALLPLMAEMIRPVGFSKNSIQIAKTFFAKHFPNYPFLNVETSIQNHIAISGHAFLRISCRHLHSMIENDSCKTVVYFLLELAAADDFIHARKMRMAQRVASYLGISENEFDGIKAKFISTNNPYFLLEIEDTASLAEVKRAYRKMILRFHPDKCLDCISEVEANDKFLQIKNAFETILKGYSVDEIK